MRLSDKSNNYEVKLDLARDVCSIGCKNYPASKILARLLATLGEEDGVAFEIRGSSVVHDNFGIDIDDARALVQFLQDGGVV